MSCIMMRADAGGGGGSRVILKNSLAIVMRKEGCQGDPGDFWMYESGYLLFQGLLSANSVCWWNNALNGATKSLVYRGYVSPGALLVDSEPCALEVLRGAWARRVLQPPAGYQIVAVEDLENCTVKSVSQTHWTPLPEAVCAVVLRLSSQGRPAGIETIREALIMTFPHVSPPSERVLYDTLTQLTSERKLYHTSSGYFIVTPERRRSRSHSFNRRKSEDTNTVGRSMLMSTEEALVRVHGEMTTIRDGDVTHQCIQTNLADVICGGNASDKILFARNNKRRSASFPSPRSPEGRGSFRFWGTRRLRRSASTRTLTRHYMDSSSATEYSNNVISTKDNTKRESLLSKLFRRSKRSQCQISTFSAQFPPTEWFNSKAVHLHSVATQTSLLDKDSALSIPYYCDTSEMSSARSATLPRRHRRQLSNDSAYIEYQEQSPLSRFGSTMQTPSTLPRNPASKRIPFHSSKSQDNSRKTSKSSLAQKSSVSASEICVEQNAKAADFENGINNSKQNDLFKITSTELIKTSHTNNTDTVKQLCGNNENFLDNSSGKNFVNLDNSGPSSIESHKSSKTGSSLTSGPSSLESHKTVINRAVDLDNTTESVMKTAKRKDMTSKTRSGSLSKATVSHSNSFTLQVTTNQAGIHSSSNNGNATTTATINSGSGANTKIYVQNSPIRSVITFENGQVSDNNPNFVIINGSESITKQNTYHNIQKDNSDTKIPMKNTNFIQSKEANVNLNNSRDILSSVVDCLSFSKIEDNNKTMNNSRKLSLQLPPREGLSYRNFLKNVPSAPTNNQYTSNSNPDSPLAHSFKELAKNSADSISTSSKKSFEGISSSAGNVYFKNTSDSKTSLENSFFECESNKIMEKNLLGSEPNICYKDGNRDKGLYRENSKDHHFPSLSDLTFNFTSLAAQKILKGVSINSIDTLVELNMAANGEKQNNCDIVHTDFGLV